MILGKKLYENHGVGKGFLFSLPSFINFVWSKFKLQSNPSRMNTSSSGVPYLVLDEKGKVLCNACRLCIDVCPTTCISLKGPEISQWTPQSKPKEFNIDLSRCTFCKLCEEICPVDAIKMSQQTTLAGASDWNWKLNMEILTKRPGINLANEEDLNSNPSKDS